MKIVKWILGIMVALAAMLLLGGMALPPTFIVTRSVTIKAPADKIYGLIADPRIWKQWSVWNQRDPAMQIEYSGPQVGTGAQWSWKSRTEGDGSMTFTQAVPGQRLGYELFFHDFGTTSNGVLELASAGAETRVTWIMNGNTGRNPLYRWMALVADGMVGKDFDAGLANLKALAEKE